MWTVRVICDDLTLAAALAGAVETAPNLVLEGVSAPGPEVASALRRPPDVLVADQAGMRWYANLAADERATVIDLTCAELLGRLTAREREVLGRVMSGASHSEIAADLSLSVHTVRFHVKQIFIKLRVHSATEAATVAARGGFQPVHAVGATRAV